MVQLPIIIRHRIFFRLMDQWSTCEGISLQSLLERLALQTLLHWRLGIIVRSSRKISMCNAASNIFFSITKQIPLFVALKPEALIELKPPICIRQVCFVVERW